MFVLRERPRRSPRLEDGPPRRGSRRAAGGDLTRGGGSDRRAGSSRVRAEPRRRRHAPAKPRTRPRPPARREVEVDQVEATPVGAAMAMPAVPGSAGSAPSPSTVGSVWEPCPAVRLRAPRLPLRRGSPRRPPPREPGTDARPYKGTDQIRVEIHAMATASLSLAGSNCSTILAAVACPAGNAA